MSYWVFGAEPTCQGVPLPDLSREFSQVCGPSAWGPKDSDACAPMLGSHTYPCRGALPKAMAQRLAAGARPFGKVNVLSISVRKDGGAESVAFDQARKAQHQSSS